MYTYSFNIYKKNCPYVYLAIFLEARERVLPYYRILIRKYNEKPDDWSTSVEESCEKEAPYSGRHFFEWLWDQNHRGYCPDPIGVDFSPFQLYNELIMSDEYDVLVDTDDPADIGDPGSYYNDMYDPTVVY